MMVPELEAESLQLFQLIRLTAREQIIIGAELYHFKSGNHYERPCII